MATTPTSVAAPPAAAAGSTAAPASSSPSSTPASSTPVQSPAVPATPQSPAGGVETPATQEMSSEAAIATMVAAAEAKGFGSEQKPAEEVKPAAATDTPAIETKPAEVVDEPGKETQEDEHAYSLEEDGFVGARDLAAKIDANEALKAALPQELRNEIIANARLAEVGAEYKELFSSPAEGRIIKKAAEEFTGYSEAFSMIGEDVSKGTTEMVRKLIEGSAFRDEKGEFMKRADGTYVTDGTAGKFFGEVFDRGFISKVVKKVEALGDENVQAALDLVMESVGMRPSTAGQDQDQDPALLARKTELDQREAEFNRQRTEEQQRATQQYTESLDGDLNKAYETEESSLLGLATALTPLEIVAVKAKLASAVKAALKASTSYKNERMEIRKKPQSEARRKEEIALGKRFLRDNLTRLAKPIFAEAGVTVGKKAQERAAAQAAREENSRSEVNGGATTQPARQVASNDPAAERARVKEEMTKKTGKVPDESEVTVQIMVNAMEKQGKVA